MIQEIITLPECDIPPQFPPSIIHVDCLKDITEIYGEPVPSDLLSLIEEWARPRGDDAYYPTSISWVALSINIDNVRKDPVAYVKRGIKEGWLKK